MTEHPTQEAIKYADYILNHYSRDSYEDKLCLVRDLQKYGWKKNEKLDKQHSYPNPYTSCDDPHVSYVRTNWRGSIIDVKSTRYSELSYECKNLVNDLVISSQLEVFKQWDRNFRRKYYTKAIFTAYEMGKESNEGFLTKIKCYCKRKFDSFAYWFVCKFF